MFDKTDKKNIDTLVRRNKRAIRTAKYYPRGQLELKEYKRPDEMNEDEKEKWYIELAEQFEETHDFIETKMRYFSEVRVKTRETINECKKIQKTYQDAKNRIGLAADRVWNQYLEEVRLEELKKAAQ